MQVVQVGQLKKDFSTILKAVQNNDEIFIIEYGKKHHKVAMLVPYIEKKEKRKENKYFWRCVLVL
ncbi:hypothetical protein BROOK1789B_1823 [Bathymodiolus brooksi thiotrophic gill symbiont]|nr:hypothetical protein BROOK1789B_1823 [Bathymodiolus brooksi thiotrophic gill symbiont]